jgi:hypothetical protein
LPAVAAVEQEQPVVVVAQAQVVFAQPLVQPAVVDH